MTGIAGAVDYKPAEDPDTCWVCRGPWRKGGASLVAKAGAAFPPSLNPPTIVQACSTECANDPRFADPYRHWALNGVDVPEEPDPDGLVGAFD